MIGSAAGVRVVRFDPRQRAVVQQAVEHVGRLMMGRRHHLDAVGAMLIGEMSIEAEAGVVPVAGVDLAGGIAALGGAKELAVGRGDGPITP